MSGRADAAPTVWLLSAAEMQRWDRRATEQLGIPERVLMESAGRGAARTLHRLYPRGRVVAAVGRGNNGGDAVVMLRALRAWGREVVAVPVGGAEIPTELLHGWALPSAREAELGALFAGAGVVVDGILGTGARGAPRAPEAAAVRAMNACGRPILALDGPTGVDLSDGSTPGEAVRAHVTVTFGAAKRGLLLFPGRAQAGRLIVLDVGFPPLSAGDAGAAVVDAAWARAHLPRIAPDAHKGRTGTVVVLAGRRGMAGAAVLVGTGALRAGAGLVHVVSARANRGVIQTRLPEAIFAARGGDAVAESLDAADALIAGPGMGTDEDSLRLLQQAVQRVRGPVLLDADALTLLSRTPDLLPPDGRERFLLTPHPGEMARLLGVATAAVVRDPFGHAARAVERFGCAVLLKGAPSLVAAPEAPALANVTGHSGIATGGMGDTLAGVAGAMLGLGAPPQEAGALALYFAGRAAQLAGRGRSLLPRDVAGSLGAALAATDGATTGEPEVLLDLPAAE